MRLLEAVKLLLRTEEKRVSSNVRLMRHLRDNEYA